MCASSLFLESVTPPRRGLVYSSRTVLALVLGLLVFHASLRSAMAASPIGINLSGVSYYSPEQPFLDIFKTGSGWVTGNSKAQQWDTGEQSKLSLDANGWPTSVTIGAGGQAVHYDNLGMLLQRAFPAPYYPGGRYVVLYEGSGIIRYWFDAVKNVALSAPGRDVIDVKPSTNGIYIQITETDPHHTGDYIRNIRVVQAQYESLLRNGEIFSPIFVGRLAPFKTLRFMDWMQTNNSKQSTVAERPTLDKAFWGDDNGVPIEVMVALANELGADAWFNMPHMASDDYVSWFAAYVHAHLGRSQKAYVEYSNETWNGLFAQTASMIAQGHARWPAAAADFATGRSFYGMRTAQVADIWKKTWGADAPRVVAVLSTQTGNYGVATLSLDASLWVGNSVKAHVDMLGITGYFGSAVPPAWTKEPDGGLDKLFREALYGGVDPNGYPGGDLQRYIDWAAENKKIADHYGLRLAAYEAGSGYVDGTGDRELAELYIRANRDPRMGLLYANFLDKWEKATGGALFNQFDDVGRYSNFGSWGALQNILEKNSPKYDALVQFISNSPKTAQ